MIRELSDVAGSLSKPKSSAKPTSNGTTESKRIAELERRLADVSFPEHAFRLTTDDFSARSIQESAR